MTIFICVCLFMLTFVTLKILKQKYQKKFLKCKKKFFLAKPKSKTFTDVCLMLNYFKTNNYKTFKSLKTLKDVDHIISCVLYKTPITYNLHIDNIILKNFGIDINLPVFFVKEYNKKYVKNLIYAKNYVKFNLIFNEDNFIKFKKLNKIKYFILNTKFASIKLLNNIMALNINTENKFKVKKEDNFYNFEIKNNKDILVPNTKIENNFLCEIYNNNNVYVEVKKCLNNGEFLYFKILNKSNIMQRVEVNYNYKLLGKYYEYHKIPNGLRVREILQNQLLFFCNSANIKYLYPNNMIKEITLPFLKLYKCFSLKPNSEEQFVLYIGNRQITKNDLYESLILYKRKIDDIVNFKIKCRNKTLEYLINYYLPNRIILEDLNELDNANADNFEECYFLFKQKKLSSLSFYLWLKHFYVGLIENENFLKFNTKLEEDFVIYYTFNNKTKEIVFKNMKSQKYMLINGVKFHNCNLISKQNLDAIDKLMLVV